MSACTEVYHSERGVSAAELFDKVFEPWEYAHDFLFSAAPFVRLWGGECEARMRERIKGELSDAA